MRLRKTAAPGIRSEPSDAADHLQTEEDQAAYPAEAGARGEPALIATAKAAVAPRAPPVEAPRRSAEEGRVTSPMPALEVAATLGTAGVEFNEEDACPSHERVAASPSTRPLL